METTVDEFMAKKVEEGIKEMLIRPASFRGAGALLKKALRAAALHLRRSGWHVARKVVAIVLVEVMTITSVAAAGSAATLQVGPVYHGFLAHLSLESFLDSQFNTSPTQGSAQTKAAPAQLAVLRKPTPVSSASPLLQSTPAAPGIALSLGFADNSSATQNFPVPWQGSANTAFLGGGTLLHAGAIRLDNTTTADIAVDKVRVDLGRPGPVFQLWSNFVIPANGSVILTQTADNNFNTSAASPLVGCGQSLTPTETRIPQITVTVAGTDTSFADAAHVLDTGGFDSSCRGNQSLAWRAVGTTGPERPSATLHLTSENAPHDVGTQTTFTGTVTDAADQPLANASLSLQVISGPNTGTQVSGSTDSNGLANLQYAGAAQGVDSGQATMRNASNGSLSSETATTVWTSADACAVSAPAGSSAKLTYVGQTSGSFGDQLRVAALLTDGTGRPLPNSALTFNTAGVTQSARTVTNGVASMTISPDIGTTAVSISFAGDQNFAAAQLTTTVTIQRRSTLLRFTGNSLLGSSGAQPLQALLTDSLGTKPIANRTVTFSVGTTQVSANTDANGVAATTITFPANQVSGPAQLAISFAGDEDYQPSSRVVPIQIYLSMPFVVWGGNTSGLRVGQRVNFWGSQWESQVINGQYFAANPSFKGWAGPVANIQACQANSTTATLTTACWQADPGASTPT